MASWMQEPPSQSSWVDHAAAADAWERQHAAEWIRVDGKLRGIAARRAALDAEEANLLRYAEELKLWRGYACGSMIEYMERAMGYAPHTAAERLRVARAIAELPLIAEALEQGGLAHSAVRELSRVAVPGTEEAWLEVARGKSLREIEALVSGHRPGHLPTDETEPRLHRKTITLEVSPETYDIWRKMHALAAEEHGQRLSDDELIPAVFRRAYGGGSGSGSGGSGGSGGTPAYKIAIKQCPDCKRAWQYSGGRDIEIDPAVAECATCDAIHLGSLDADVPERTTTTVTARKREQVLARDGHGCTVPGCRRNVGLDLHHIEYQSRGGGHELKNLTTICDLHHRAAHYGKLVIRGTAPDHLTFEFRKPRDRRNVTDDEPSTPRNPSAERLHAERPHTNRSLDDQPLAERSLDNQPRVDRLHADRSLAERPHTDRSRTDHSLTDQPLDNRMLADRSLTDRLHVDRSLAERPLTDRSLTDQPLADLADRSLDNQSRVDRLHADRSHTERPLTDRSLTDQPLADHSLDDCSAALSAQARGVSSRVPGLASSSPTGDPRTHHLDEMHDSRPGLTSTSPTGDPRPSRGPARTDHAASNAGQPACLSPPAPDGGPT
ncbi:MAG TPA: HNH endonuclease signature motif containing protein [Kofleriaceae bacterium]|nr:HNH endonuclease signature motif containing protein [Kofleriaceae bacterium]